MNTIMYVNEVDLYKSIMDIKFKRYDESEYGYILKIEPFILIREEKGFKIPMLIESIHINTPEKCKVNQVEFLLWSEWEMDVMFIDDKRFVKLLKSYLRLI